jgi:hypothetical protein
MALISNFTWEPTIRPLEAVQGAAATWDLDLSLEDPPGSGLVKPYDLTGLTVTLSMSRETRQGSDLFTPELAAVACTIRGGDPTTGRIRCVVTAAQLAPIPDGDHCVQLAISDGASIIDKLPRGRSFVRAIIGKAL